MSLFSGLPPKGVGRLNQVAKLMVGLWLLVFLPAWSLYSVLNAEKTPRLIEPYEPPILQAEPWQKDIGHVKTDGKAHAVFRLVNLGGKTLNILSVEPSCGCTVATLSTKTIMPGQLATLSLDLDTSLKLGQVKKEIILTTNDPKHPHATLTLLATVDPNFQGHQKIAVKNRLVLFQGECATCHVNKGVGKSGEALFNADCAMCHGVQGKGRVAPALVARLNNAPDARYHQPAFLSRFKTIIAEGAPDNPGMPPFSHAQGGPLSDSQIDSLLTYLNYLALSEQSGS